MGDHLKKGGTEGNVFSSCQSIIFVNEKKKKKEKKEGIRRK